MGYIKEPDGIDFVVINRPLTEKGKKLFSDFLKTKKKKRRIFKLQSMNAQQKLESSEQKVLI